MAQPKQIKTGREWANAFLSESTDMSGPAAGMVEDWLVKAYNAGLERAAQVCDAGVRDERSPTGLAGDIRMLKSVGE